MLSQALRASRPIVARAARQQFVARRSIMTPSAVRGADLVQDMYLRELKTQKVAAPKLSDADGHVSVFSAPKTPASPEETDMASQLGAYEAQTVEIEGQAEPGTAAKEHDWFEEEPEEDAAHH